ncbi:MULTISPECIES: hypothetical protein [Carboxydothermus]|uniref:Conserved domain protein n=2 Tax=Carboxydothermus TaxID=129957 RepID=Q3AF70_CARHZ|nr:MULTISPECIES: hypothetical protein [Carboxydothermus]ABB14439.1 conserved domain protein [Carboxydothermus hydrogenoformans Z-2901]NYE57259.1 putative membrane protein [Carboxydothermus ferrireducens DSM 11255]
MLMAVIGLLLIIATFVFCECGLWYFIFYHEKKPFTPGYIALSLTTGFLAFIAMVLVLYFIIYPPNIMTWF